MNKNIKQLMSQQGALIGEQIIILERIRTVKNHHLDIKPTPKMKRILLGLEEQEDKLREQILSLNIAMLNEYDKEMPI